MKLTKRVTVPELVQRREDYPGSGKNKNDIRIETLLWPLRMAIFEDAVDAFHSFISFVKILGTLNASGTLLSVFSAKGIECDSLVLIT